MSTEATPGNVRLNDQLGPLPERGWLIEHYTDFPRRGWLRVACNGSVNGIARGELEWTADANLALRFARRTDAEHFALLNPGWCTLANITEHQFGLKA